MGTDVKLRISVVYSPSPRTLREFVLELPPGSRVRQALQLSGLQAGFPALDLKTALIGVWGRKTGLDHVLRDQDRVEIYRPLQVDPKVARRERFVRQGARTTGLFARKRAGAKAGY